MNQRKFVKLWTVSAIRLEIGVMPRFQRRSNSVFTKHCLGQETLKNVVDEAFIDNALKFNFPTKIMMKIKSIPSY